MKILDDESVFIKPQRSNNKKIQELWLQIFLISVGLLVAAPIFIAIFASFKLPEDIVNYPPTLLPEVWTFENYVTAWTQTPFARFFINSIVQTGIIVACNVLFSILAAYAFSVLQFPGRDGLFFVVLISLMIPFQLTFIPNFELVTELGWSDSYQGLTVPFLASALGVFMLRQFFLSIPHELYDSAIIDGANNWQYLWRILVPLSKGSISAFAIFSFLSAWSQYLWPLIITSDENWRTIQIGLRFFLFDQERGADWGAIMAASVIALIPTLIIFLVAQKQLVKGIAMTGLKG